jgi:hypothetical protein
MFCAKRSSRILGSLPFEPRSQKSRAGSLSIIFNYYNHRNLSTGRGLYNTKKIIRREPKILITENVLGAKDGEKNEYSDKFMKGEVRN